MYCKLIISNNLNLYISKEKLEISQVFIVGAGSFIGQILEYDDESHCHVSDVERLVSELDSRLCLEINSTDADDDTDVDDDDDDESEANLPSQVTLQHLWM